MAEGRQREETQKEMADGRQNESRGVRQAERGRVDEDRVGGSV